MKALAAIISVLLLSTVSFAQHPNRSVGTNSGFGNVLFPAGKPTTGQPFTLISPNFGAGRPANGGFRGNGAVGNRGGNVIYVPYAYPLVTGGYYGGYGYGYADPSMQQQQQPNVVVVYPQQQQQAPVILMGTPGGQPGDVPRSSIQDYSAPPSQATTSADTSGAGADYYLLAFKDHSIYSAIGYWVDGDTLHYLTTGNVHNQASLSLVDRDLTAQLNRGRGVQVSLPPAPSR